MPRNYKIGSGSTGRVNRQTAHEKPLLAPPPKLKKPPTPVGGQEVRVPADKLVDPRRTTQTGKEAQLKALNTDPDGNITVLVTPDEVPAGMEREEWLEMKVAACERLMLQGVRDTRMLMKLLELGRSTVEKLVKRVEARWTALGGAQDLRGARGEALSHLEMIINEYWSNYRTAENQETAGNRAFQKTMILSYIMQAMERKMTLQGLSTENVQMLLHVSDDAEVVQRIRRHSVIGEFAGKLLDVIAKRRSAQAMQEAELSGRLQEAVIVEERRLPRTRP